MRQHGRLARACVLLACLSVVCFGDVHGMSPKLGLHLDELVSGPVTDAKCNVSAVDRANDAQLASILHELMDTTFFRLISVSLDEECQFFDHAAPVAPASCSAGAGAAASAAFGGGASSFMSPSSPVEEPTPACSLETDGFLQHPTTDRVDDSLSQREGKAFPASAQTCDDETQPSFWLDMCDEIKVGGSGSNTINLRKNPERWTGYNGSAVWRAIYQENCLKHGANEDMCYEERVLYKLLSAMHTSINVHISLAYHPPRKGKRTHWEPNPKLFVERYAAHPERINNLHFAFVVLMRAVRKAGPYLRGLDYDSVDAGGADAKGSAGDSIRTRELVELLLGTRILESCREVFDAFDESLLFAGSSDGSKAASLKREFKHVFRNVTRILDCVSCQKCKLHGKLALLGLGTALKILLLPTAMLDGALRREEVVALINTLGKFSHSIQGARALTRMVKEEEQQNRLDEAGAAAKVKLANDAAGSKTTSATASFNGALDGAIALGDKAVALISGLAASGALSREEEDKLIDGALIFDPRVLILAKHYSSDAKRFARHASRVLATPLPAAVASAASVATRTRPLDLIVIGGGLTGLVAALTVLDAGGRVVLLEKEPFLGGNSAWASSGINAAPGVGGDTRDAFANDTLGSGGGDPELVAALVDGSLPMIEWVEKRLDIRLNLTAQLGGHSYPRTRRSKGGMIGQELVLRIQRLVKTFAREGGTSEPRLRLLTKTRATRIEQAQEGPDGMASVTYEDATGTQGSMKARFVAIATGGFGNDGGSGGLLARHRPDVAGLPTTNGRWATGDGVRLGEAAGAAIVDMQLVQVHPTAFVNPADVDAPRKTLCAELLRGVGGLLLDGRGRRFVDELGTRDHVVAQMRAATPYNGSSNGAPPGGFVILLSDKMATAAGKHAEHYLKKGLLKRFASLADTANWLGLGVGVLRDSLREYAAVAERGVSGPFGKRFFHNAPLDSDGGFVAGVVIPAVHYTMGGLRVGPDASVLDAAGMALPGLLAGGEVTGGMHGKNRLGGNALTECAVFGRIIGSRVIADMKATAARAENHVSGAAPPAPAATLPIVTPSELAKHTSSSDCWLALYGKVYDMTDFLDEHPAGPEAILDVAGRDATEEFEAIHSKGMLDDFDIIGVYSDSSDV